MRVGTGLVTAVMLCALAGGATALFDCASNDDDSVTIVTACDTTQLRSDPAEQTAKLFAEASADLLNQANDLEKKFTDVCNAINSESGSDQGGDIRTACNKIAERLAKAQSLAPIPDGGVGLQPGQPGGPAIWALVAFDDRPCAIDTAAEAACLTQCGTGPCDPLNGCPPEQQSGTCAGQCTGICKTPAGMAKQTCFGACVGACDAPEGGVACSGAECTGGCTAATWVGRCDVGCDKAFIGFCDGTCTGTCDMSPIGDAGMMMMMDAGGGDSGEGGAEGGTEAGPPDAGPTPPAPGGADGNCTGLCTGTCSKNATGSCGSKCRGVFSGGECGAGPARCTGSCTASPTTACTTSCSGACEENDAGSCQGTCVGGCSVPLTSPKCSNEPTCDANDQCKAVCQVKAALATNCATSPDAQVRLAGDQKLYAAIKNHLPDFADLVVKTNLLNQRSLGISHVTLDDYKALGATRDRVRVCVLQSVDTTAQARASLSRSVSASQIMRGISF